MRSKGKGALPCLTLREITDGQRVRGQGREMRTRRRRRRRMSQERQGEERRI